MREAFKVISFSLALVTLLARADQASPPAIWADIAPTASATTGEVVITAPGGDFKGFTVQLYRRTSYGQRFTVPAAGHPYRANAGELCLSINDGHGFTFNRCNYKVTAGQRLEIPLARITFHWNDALAHVDIPPRLQATFAEDPATPGDTYASTAVFLDQNGVRGVTHLLPEGQYAVRYAGTPLFAGAPRKFSLKAGEVRDEDISPDEKRATLHIHVPALKYPVPQVPALKNGKPYLANYARLLARTTDVTRLQRYYPTYSLGMSACYQMGLDAKAVFDLGDPNRDRDYTFRVFPSGNAGTTTPELELVVNEVVQVLKLSPGEVRDIRLEPLNVGALDRTIDGSYRVVALPPGETNEAKGIALGWIGQATSRYQCATRAQESTAVGQDPFTHRTLTGHLFPTRTSLYLLPGWKYVIRTYAFDDLGGVAEQSRHEVDLLPKP